MPLQVEPYNRPSQIPDLNGTESNDTPCTPKAFYIQPSDAQLALCSLYANRWYTMKRLLRVSTRLGIKPEMKVWDQFLIRRTGQRMITFVTDIKKLEDGRKVMLALNCCFHGMHIVHSQSTLGSGVGIVAVLYC